MKKLLYLAIVALCVMVASSCDDEKFGGGARTTADSTIFIKGYEYLASLVHHPDSSQKDQYSDPMDSKMSVWATVDGERQLPAVHDGTEHPTLRIGSLLAKQDYAISEEHLNCQPSSSQVLRDQRTEKDGSITEVDTIVYTYPDGQVWTVPVSIGNASVDIAGNKFDYPSMTFTAHEWQYRHDVQKMSKTRAQYMSGDYTSEHKSIITLKEINIQNPKEMRVPIYAFTSVFTMKDDCLTDIQTDTLRQWIDPQTEKDVVTITEVYESGITISQTFETETKHFFRGDDPYEKEVTNWNHKNASSTEIAWGAEKKDREDSLWTVYGKDGHSFENYENGVDADKAPAKFNYYVERPVFQRTYHKNGKDTLIIVDFGYAPIHKEEMQYSITSVESDKEGKDKAILKSVLSTLYLGGGQSLTDEIYLYMDNDEIEKEVLIKKDLHAVKDSVLGYVDYEIHKKNGEIVKVHDNISAPWTIVNKSDWTSTQEILSQNTENTVAVNLTGSNAESKGNWHWKRNVYDLLNNVTLYDGEVQVNKRESSVPNEFVYITPNGTKFAFDTLPYKVDEKGAALNLKGEEGTLTAYDYNEVIEETLGDYTRSNTAHGTLNISAEKILKKEARNLVQTELPDRVHNEFDRVYVYASHEDVTHMTHDFPRKLERKSEWTANEKDASEKTAQPVAKMIGTKATKDDDGWSCDMQTRSITAAVTLSASTQYNEWEATDPNNVKYEEEGLVVKFDNIKHTVAYVNSNTSLKSTEGLTETYAYNNTISVVYGNDTQSISAPGTIIVTKGKEVIGHDMRNKRYDITNDAVTAIGDYYSLYNDGSEDFVEVKKTAPRSINPLGPWNVKDVNSSVLTGSASVKLLSSDAKKDGAWSWTNKKRKTTTEAQLQSSTQTNAVETVDPDMFKYDDGVNVYEWGEIDFSAAEAGQNVKHSGTKSGVDSYDYTDKVTLTYGTNIQTVTLSGVIKVENKIVKRTVIRDEQTTSANGVNSKLTIRNEWTNGDVTEETLEHFFDGNLRCLTNWSSDEDNADQSTSSASVSLSSSSQRKEGEWTSYDETEDISTEATLNGSKQTNKWQSKYSKRVVFESADGLLRHDFGAINFSVQEKGANVSKRSEDEDGAMYDYTDNIGVTYGNASFDSSAPGQIYVKTPWNPDFRHGKFTGCVITTARNEGRNTWVYVASVHFETGTMPLIIRQGASAPEVNEDYFEANTDSRLNSGTWVPSWGKWINTIAEDTPDLMQWSTTEGANADNMAYPTATAWGWDYGYTVSGHPTVFTDKFSAKISNDGYVLTIYSGNKVFATYKANKK